MPLQKLYNIHYNSSECRQYKWFIQAAEALRRQHAVQEFQQTLKALQTLQNQQEKKRQKTKARQLQQRQKTKAARIAAEKAARLTAEAFACRQCPAKFASNTKLHEHVRTKHTKKPNPPPQAPASSPATSPTCLPTTPRKPIS